MTPPVVAIAFADDFLSALVALPPPIQKKATVMLRKFRQDPQSGGLNYEHVTARDARVRSLRVDQGYRAILLAPEKGATYTFVFVGAHDEAYRWAKNRSWSVNPATGGIDVVEIPEGVASPAPAVVPAKSGARSGAPAALFAGLAEEEAARLGVTEVLLPHVRGFLTREEFEAAGAWFPKDTHENLWFLLEGFTVEDVLSRPERRDLAVASVDPEDFDAALQAPASSGAFHIVEDDRDLEEILAAPLEKWRIFLHPSQKRTVIRDLSGPARVLGGPGTGKTVVALHRARELARRFFPDPTKRILLTTFTTNLAKDLEENLIALCGDERKRIDVRNVDSVILSVLRACGKTPVFPDTDDVLVQHWSAALAIAPVPGFDVPFLREEYEHVVQAQACDSESAYLAASRTGRKRPLSRAERRALWATCAAYRTELARSNLMTWNDAADLARQLLETGKATRAWAAAVIDEAQDLSPPKLRFLRALIPQGRNDLLLAGDAHQRIYGRPAPLSRVGIDIRGRSSRLTLNYRTTREIAAFAMGILHGVTVDDLDEAPDDLKGYRSIRTGPGAEVMVFETEEAEEAAVAAFIHRLTAAALPLDSILVTCRTSSLARRFGDALSKSGIKVHDLGSPSSPPREPAVRIATLHRVKGLEFRAVAIPALRDTLFPHPKSREPDEPESSWHARERQLLFVACTRARDHLLLLASGNLSPLMPSS